VAAGAIGALSIVGTAWLARSGAPVVSSAPASQLSIAVLAFENTGDPETQYLSDGVSESLINSLSVLPHLRVVARATAFRYRGRQADLKKVAQELGVRSVVTGSLFQRGDELRIQVDLVDTATGSQVWGRQCHRASREIVVVQQEMAMAVAQKLRLPLSSSDREQLPGMLPRNAAAHHAYLQGRFFWNKRSPKGLRKAIQYFEQAIREDPGYAPAHAGLSDAYATSSWYASIPAREAVLNARPAAMAALKLAPDSAEAHASLGLVHQVAGNYEAGRQEMIRALELNPASGVAQRALGLYFLWVVASRRRGSSSGWRTNSIRLGSRQY
jgi:TolB-like protein